MHPWVYIASGVLAVFVIVLICIAKKIVKKKKTDDFAKIFNEEYGKKVKEEDNAKL